MKWWYLQAPASLRMCKQGAHNTVHSACACVAAHAPWVMTSAYKAAGLEQPSFLTIIPLLHITFLNTPLHLHSLAPLSTPSLCTLSLHPPFCTLEHPLAPAAKFPSGSNICAPQGPTTAFDVAGNGFPQSSNPLRNPALLLFFISIFAHFQAI